MRFSPKKPSNQRFSLRVALRPRGVPPPHHDVEEDVDLEEEEKDKEPVKRGRRGMKPLKSTKVEKSVRFEGEETPVVQQAASPHSSDSDPEEASFLEKRAKNIKANKAMVIALITQAKSRIA